MAGIYEEAGQTIIGSDGGAPARSAVPGGRRWAYAQDAGDGVKKNDALVRKQGGPASLGPLTPAVRSY